MALSGTLADVAVVDLLQLPHVGKRTGRMTLRCGKQSAQVYFQDGSITHAVLGDRQGMDVLVDLLDWSEGDFLFEAGVACDVRTLQTDLHRSIMIALKLRDERQQERQRAQREDHSMETVTQELLERFVTATAAIRDVSLVRRNGDVVARAHRDPELEGLAELRSELVTLFVNHARGGLSRVVMEDESGVVVGHAVEDALLILVYAPGTAVGIAIHAVGKLITEVARSGGVR